MKTDIQTEAVQKMQDYIEAHVFDVVTPGALSRITGYSPWYAARLFFQFLNMTPADLSVSAVWR
jgi:AraC family transcriptional regulator